jgi:predicted lipoprotein with Yx(FWY)xxD motif
MHNRIRSVVVREYRPVWWLVAAVGVTALLTAFLTHPPTARSTTLKSGTVLHAASTKLGNTLVTASGRTLYLFAKDKNGKSSCTGQCASFWPPLLTSGKPRAGAGIKASLLGTTKRSNGQLQVTYNHHPLYTFVKDKAKGQTNGEGVDAYGAHWYAVSPAGSKITHRPAPGGIPQNNGGDHDADNNGGPSDGDGNI